MTDTSDRTAGIQQLWTVGSYEVIAAMFAPISDEVVAELDVAGKRVLDAATGTGNTALAAAAAGADVDAFDLTPRLLDVARERATSAGLDIRFEQGDLVDIPYADDTFDLVISTFGAFTVDDQQACARELVRVCRPGGMVVTTAWSDEGSLAELRRLAMERHPAPPEPDQPEPRWWSDPERLEWIFADLPVEISLERRTVWFAFPTTEFAMTILELASGPIQTLAEALEQHEPGTWKDVRREVLAVWDDMSQPAGHGIELASVYGLATVRVLEGGEE